MGKIGTHSTGCITKFRGCVPIRLEKDKEELEDTEHYVIMVFILLHVLG